MPAEPTDSPTDAATIDALLRRRAEMHGDRDLYTFLGDGESVTETCDYQTLDQRAREIANWLRQEGLSGEPVVLVFPEGIDYAAAFFGCLYAGAIAAPANPPRRNQRSSRLEGIIADSGARCILTNRVGLTRAKAPIDEKPILGNVPWKPIEEIAGSACDQWSPPPNRPDAPAFLQYTSGSTGSPKGVVVTHANLMANQRHISEAFGQDESIVVGGWLPIYHDMGLIGNILHPLYLGGQLVFMPPVAFLQKPIRWLRMIADHGVTIAGGPNFAFDLCVRETTETERDSLDLSGWQVAFNGSEPIHAATIRRFVEAFEPAGFRKQAFCPCYGMAETTLLVTGSRQSDEPLLATVNAAELRDGNFKKTQAEPTATQELAGSGPLASGVRIEIVDPDTRQSVDPNKIGEIWVAGETVAYGYWNRVGQTDEAFGARLANDDPTHFLRTGDLGALHDGELFVTGRSKDLIIIRGANHYPQDIEETARQAHPAVEGGAAIAVSVNEQGEERLAILQEVRRNHVRKVASSPQNQAEIGDAIRCAVAEQHNVSVDTISLVRTASLPKTSSGKLQRSLAKELLLRGELKTVGATETATKGAGSAARDERARLDSATRSEVDTLQRWIVQRIAERRGIEVTEIDPDQPFACYGLDSLAAVRLSGELSDRLRRDISPTLAYDFPTPAAVACYLIVGEDATSPTNPSLQAAEEPLAIIGIGCRFPGAADVESYWRLLSRGDCSISPAPVGRWQGMPATDREPGSVGGYLPAIDGFDPAFFGVSPREAALMDPQQRLLLEVAWETLENAGARPDKLRRQAVGVFVGVSAGDYSRLQAELLAETDPYSAIGGSLAIIANRLSYTFDFRGPSWSVDTACSSSLVAVHQAADAIRRGDCDTALAGGVNLIVSESPTQSLSLSGMLSSFGLCRAFCFGGDGFVRGEGCGLVLLRRLGSALASGDRVLGVLRGTAVNQDGRSNGLTAPNGPAQQAVIRRALATSGLRPADIDYLEAHGTGTELGDPTEMGALGAVFAPGRDPERPLMVGSAKTNLGHLEGAAGVAGLIKACLALHHQQLPPHPFFDPHDDGPNGPNPHIDWSLPVAIPNRLTPWPRSEGRVRRAGVSSFGFGGTNAHAILEEAPGEAVGSAKLSAGGRPLAAGGDEDGNEDAGRRTHWVTLSAKTPAALDALAERYADALPGQLADASLAEIAYAANTGRAAMAERLAVRADSRAQLAERLRERGGSAHAVRGAAPRAATAGWLFGGQGGCRPGMGRGLYQRFEAFREEWDACEAALKEHWPRSLKTLCWEEPERLQAVDAQVALVAWQIALAALWRRWAGEPAWVAGHSLGELAAAVTAGVLDRDDALAIVCRRAALLDDLPQRGATQQRGAMLAVMAPAEEVEAALTGGLVVAAYNGPRQTVVSGAVEAIERFAAESPLRSKRLATTHAFHSPLIEPAADALAEACGGVAMHAPRLGLLSTLTGQPLQEAPPADYWARQMRRPVRFAEALAHAPADAPKLELSPTPVLRALVDGAVEPAAGWRDANDQAGGANSHAGGANDEADGAEAAAARLWVAGVAIDFRALHPPQRLAVALPNYPFQRQRHWFKPSKKKRGTADNGAGQPPHPLLGRRVELAIGGGDTLVFEADLAEQPWLEDHQLRGRPTLPATAVIEIAWAAGAVIDPDKRWRVEDLCLERPLAWDPEAEAVRVQTVLTRQPEGNHRVELFQHTPSRQTPSRHNDAAWRRTAHGLLTPEDRTNPPPNADDLLKAFGEAELETRDPAQHYADCHQAGLQYGPAFQAITSLQARSAKNGSPAKAKAHIKLQPNTPNKNYLIQPTITDAALQTIAQTIKQQKPNTAWVPKTVRKAVGWKNVENNADLQAWATLSDSGAEGDAADELVADVHLLTLNGEAVADLLGVRLAKLAGREPKRFFHTVWKPQLRANESSPPPQVSAKAIGARLPDLTPEIATETGANTRQGLLAGLEELSSQYAVHAVLGDNAQRFAVGQVLTTDDFAATLAISENKRRLLNRLLVIASEEGSLKLTADGWRVARTPQSFSFAQHIRSLISAHPEGRPELTLVQRCGEQLTAVLRGEIDPLSLLFPAEGAGAADLYRYSAGSVALNRMVAEAVAEIAAHLPVGRALRVLEIGAGSGATTGEVLRRVGVERIRYVFTDVAAGFFGAAKLRLLEQDNLTYQTLDIERDPRQQGFELGAFDVVVAANVLHATADLSQAVANAHRLLAPGGQLLLIEGTTPTQWLDITFGMTEGWWRFTDHRLRPDYPLLGVDAWRDVLSRAGLSEFACESPVATSVGESPENAVMIATASASSVPVSVSGNYTILHWEPESADAIVEELRSRGATVDSHCLGSTVRRARISDLLPKRTAGEVVVIPPEVNADAASAESLVGGLLTVLQAVADWEGAIGDEATVSRSVTVITRNAQLPSPQSGAEPISTGHAAVAGMVRAAARELPGVSFRIVDVPHQPFDASAIADEVLNGDATEAEVALRCSGRFVRRLVDGSPAYQSGEARQLRIADRGAIDSLKIATTRRRNPGRGEVLIRVVAAGLNFRDLWNTLGRYPGEPPLGAELSGVVEQIGQGVEDLAVGDGVIAVAGDSIADFVTTPAESVLRLPQAIDMASAATLPVAFGTAALAIEQLAATKPGDRVLIHTATGGVGTAALQLAAARGAEVFATASLGKHRLLRQQGFQHVYDSRCDTFADEVLADTNRHGVDVIVNTLGEERFDANLKALAQGGVYVDLTKPESNLADKFAKLRPDAEYHLVDLARDWEEDPPKIRQLLEPILTRVASGELDSLPFQAFDLRAAKQAFRTMQQATHIGKLIVTPNERAAARQPDQLKAGEACLITGGFGDLGLLTARWFAEQGMGVIGLVGRGEPSRTALETIQQLEANGVRILPLRADVSDENQLAEAITEVRSTGAALTAVVHSAGTLDDGLLQDQSTQKIAAVFAGKAHGLWNLHRLTKGDPLKRFVAYSSVASVFGAPGQANHATANAFMDAVIDQRRAEGRCGLAINWGPWQAIGEAARRGVEARTDLGGIRLLSPEKGYKAIDELLGSDAAGQVMVAPWDLQQTPDWLRASPLLEDLLVSEDKSAHAVNTQFLHTYRATPRFQRRDLLADHLRQKLAMVLNIADESAITPTTAMFDLGLDSLTTIELKNAIRYSTGLDLPANLVFDFPTLDRLADEVHKRLQVEVGASSTEDEEIKRTESSGPPPSVHLATPPTEEAKDRQLEAAAGVWDDLAALEAELDSWEGT